MARKIPLFICATLMPALPLIAQAQKPANQQPASAESAPITSADIGAFPHIQTPAGYTASNAKSLAFEEKYIFPGGKLRTVEGPYYHADIFADGGEWNETLLLSQLDKQIIGKGGVRVFDGPMPAAVQKMIDENEPRFAKDLYDFRPYRFRQYLIRTKEKLVWIELGYRYNAHMIDLSVITEDVKN